MLHETRDHDSHVATSPAAASTVPLALDSLRQDDAVVASDGVLLGTAQGLHEGGPWDGQLLVQGPAAHPEPHLVYTIPLHGVAAVDEHSRTLHLRVSSSYARSRWVVESLG